MADLIWTTTDAGYYARGATTNYNINRTPGHRFWLCLDGAQVKSGKLTELKDAAQRNENAGGGANDGPKSDAGRPKPTGNGRTKPKPPTPTATTPDTTIVPTTAINREYVGAVETTTPDAYPPVRGAAVTAADEIPGHALNDGCPLHPHTQSVIQAAAQTRETWAAEGATREGVVREFGELLGVTAPPVAAPAPDADDDGDDSDTDTPLVPNVSDPPHHDHGNPVGVHPQFSVTGTQTFRTPCARQSATTFPRPLVNAFPAALRPVAKIVAGDGRPVRSWLGGVIR